jgi:hypothetical protein
MIEANISIHALPKTVGDVRQWLSEVDTLGLSDDTPLDDGILFVYLNSQPVEFIDCGDHISPGDGTWPWKDLLVTMHDCRGPEYGYQQEKPE